jgi:transcriptional regulator with XRE-family HTH domain
MITAAQCRAARAWLDLTQAELAEMVGCTINVVLDFERGQRATTPAYVIAMQHVLEGLGILFLSPYGQRRSGIEGPD